MAGPWQPQANEEEMDVRDSSQEESQETHACEVVTFNTPDLTISPTEARARSLGAPEAGKRGGQKPKPWTMGIVTGREPTKRQGRRNSSIMEPEVGECAALSTNTGEERRLRWSQVLSKD